MREEAEGTLPEEVLRKLERVRRRLFPGWPALLGSGWRVGAAALTGD